MFAKNARKSTLIFPQAAQSRSFFIVSAGFRRHGKAADEPRPGRRPGAAAPKPHTTMFESVELGHKLSKEQYNAELPKLRSELLQAHFQLRGQDFPVIVIVSGADGAGKGELVHRLNEWLDPRGVETHAFWDPATRNANGRRTGGSGAPCPAAGASASSSAPGTAIRSCGRVYGEIKSSRLRHAPSTASPHLSRCWSMTARSW